MTSYYVFHKSPSMPYLNAECDIAFNFRLQYEEIYIIAQAII